MLLTQMFVVRGLRCFCLKANADVLFEGYADVCCSRITYVCCLKTNADVLFEGYADVRCLKAYSGALRVTGQIPPTEVGGFVQVLSIRLPTRT